MRLLAAALTVVAVVAGAALPGAATPAVDQGLSLPVDRTDTKPFWASYRVRLDGEQFVAKIGVGTFTYPAHAAAYLFDADGMLLFGLTSTNATVRRGSYVHVNAVPGYDITYDTREPNDTYEAVGPGAEFSFNTPGSTPLRGDFNLLFLASGGIHQVVHSIDAEPGAQLLATDEGDDAFLHTGEDFQGIANAQYGVRAAPPGFQHGSRVTVAGDVSLQVDDTLIGLYHPYATPILPGMPPSTPFGYSLMSADTPMGQRTCPCTFRGFSADSLGPAATAGTYSFHLTGAGLESFSNVYLAGADARLPLAPD